MVCSPPIPHGILQARVLEWVAISSCRGIFPTQGLNPHFLCRLHCRQLLYCWAIGEAAQPGFQFSSVAQSCPTLCDPMNLSMPGLPVHHQLPEFTQTNVHWVSDAIQLSHPLSFPSPPAHNPSSIRVFSNESTLRMRWPKYWSFSFSLIPSKNIPGLISFRMDWLDLLAVQGLSRVFSNTFQKHQFFGAQPSSQSNSHIHTWLLEKP